MGEKPKRCPELLAALTEKRFEMGSSWLPASEPPDCDVGDRSKLVDVWADGAEAWIRGYYYIDRSWCQAGTGNLLRNVLLWRPMGEEKPWAPMSRAQEQRLRTDATRLALELYGCRNAIRKAEDRSSLPGELRHWELNAQKVLETTEAGAALLEAHGEETARLLGSQLETLGGGVYRGYVLEHQYADGQPDSWVFCHKEYDGPGDKRLGHGPSLAAICRGIDEQLEEQSRRITMSSETSEPPPDGPPIELRHTGVTAGDWQCEPSCKFCKATERQHNRGTRAWHGTRLVDYQCGGCDLFYTMYIR